MGKVYDLTEFDIHVSYEEFTDIVVDFFNTKYSGTISVDDLLLNPREAVRFCDELAAANGWVCVPDELPLRALLNRRKNP